MTTLTLEAEHLFVQLLPHSMVNLTLTDITNDALTYLSSIDYGTMFDSVCLRDYDKAGTLNEVRAQWKVTFLSFTLCNSRRHHGMLSIAITDAPPDCPFLGLLNNSLPPHVVKREDFNPILPGVEASVKQTHDTPLTLEEALDLEKSCTQERKI